MKRLKFFGKGIFIPADVWKNLETFLLDRRTGSVTFIIRGGRVFSSSIEDTGATARAEVRTQL